MEFTRQEGLVNMDRLGKVSVTIIGSGAVGSFSALTISKMGVRKISVFDEDGVSEHNLPNQFFRKKDVGEFKVDALQDMLRDFSEVEVDSHKTFYKGQKLNDVVIVATDSMRSRKFVWEQFKKQEQCRYYIEARMGGEFGMVYVVRKIPMLAHLGGNQKHIVDEEDIEFYEERLYPDSKVKPLPCTARSIIYNVLVIAAVVARSVKSIANGEKFPREIIFNLRDINAASFMVRE